MGLPAALPETIFSSVFTTPCDPNIYSLLQICTHMEHSSSHLPESTSQVKSAVPNLEGKETSSELNFGSLSTSLFPQSGGIWGSAQQTLPYNIHDAPGSHSSSAHREPRFVFCFLSFVLHKDRSVNKEVKRLLREVQHSRGGEEELHASL